jgi:hypothetical protein
MTDKQRRAQHAVQNIHMALRCCPMHAKFARGGTYRAKSCDLDNAPYLVEMIDFYPFNLLVWNAFLKTAHMLLEKLYTPTETLGDLPSNCSV